MENGPLNHELFRCSETAQIIQLVIKPGQTITAGIVFSNWFDEGIRFEKNTDRTGSSNKGGFGKLLDSGIKKLGRENREVVFCTNSTRITKNIALAAPSGRRILSIPVSEQDRSFFCHKDPFVCAESGLELLFDSGSRSKYNFKGMGKTDWLEFRGNGTLFVHVGGSTKKARLKKQKIKIDHRSIVGFAGGITHEWVPASISKRNRSDMQAYFRSKLSGSGTVYLQGKPFEMPKQAQRLTHDIAALVNNRASALYKDNLKKIKNLQWSDLQDMVSKENLPKTLKAKIDLRSRLKKLTAKKS